MNDRHDDWRPREASVLDDQRAAYDEMRNKCPVAHSEFMGWSLFRHADIVQVLQDPKAFSSASRHPAIPNGMDPPEHGRYRQALEPLFATERIAALEPWARKIAGDLVDAMVRDGHGEVVGSYADPFALRTLCAFLGWPEQLWECLGGWTHGNQQAALSRDRSAGRALARLIREHVQLNLDEHRQAGHDAEHTTDALLATTIDGASLDDEQIVSVLRNWIAGEGTVAAAISLLALHLAEQPDLQSRLRRDPSMVPAAVEEVLRFDGPLVANRRTAVQPVELGGKQIGAGETITLMWIAANRDPNVFPRAAELDLERDPAESLVWGRGIHVCLGAPLARLQLRVAVEELLGRTARFEVRGTARRAVYPSNGLTELSISVT